MISVYALVKQLGIGVVIAEENWNCREGAVSDGVRSRRTGLGWVAVSDGVRSRAGSGLGRGAVSVGCGPGWDAVLGEVRYWTACVFGMAAVLSRV